MKTKTNKKFLSLILAISMTLTSFAGLTITTASADGEPALSDWSLNEATYTGDFTSSSFDAFKTANPDWTFGNSTGAAFNASHATIDTSAKALKVLYNGTATYGVVPENGSYYYTYKIKFYSTTDGNQKVVLKGGSSDYVLLQSSTSTADYEVTTVVDTANKKAYTYKVSDGSLLGDVVNITDGNDVTGISFECFNNQSQSIYIYSFKYGTEHVIPAAPSNDEITLEAATDSYNFTDSSEWTSGDLTTAGTTTQSTAHNKWSFYKKNASDIVGITTVENLNSYTQGLQLKQDTVATYTPDTISGSYYFTYSIYSYNKDGNHRVVLTDSSTTTEINTGYSTYLADETNQKKIVTFTTVVDADEKVAYTYTNNNGALTAYGDPVELSSVYNGLNGIAIKTKYNAGGLYVFNFAYGPATINRRVVPTEAPEYSTWGIGTNTTAVYTQVFNNDTIDTWAELSTVENGNWSMIGDNRYGVRKEGDNIVCATFTWGSKLANTNKKTDGKFYYKYTINFNSNSGGNQLVRLITTNHPGDEAEGTVITADQGDTTYAIFKSPTAYDKDGKGAAFITIVDDENKLAYTYPLDGDGNLATVSGLPVVTDYYGDTLTGIQIANIVRNDGTPTIRLYDFEYGEFKDTETLEINIDYENAQLTGFTEGERYTVAVGSGSDTAVTVKTGGVVDINSAWYSADDKLTVKKTGTELSAEVGPLGTLPTAPASTTYEVTQPTTTDGKGSIAEAGGTTNLEYKVGANGAWTTLPASNLAQGAEVYIRAKAVAEVKDEEGNVTTAGKFASEATSAIKINTITQETKPTLAIDYINETLGTFTADEKYTIKAEGVDDAVKTGSATTIDITPYLGKTVSVVKNGTAGTSVDSTAATIAVPTRPSAPSAQGNKPTSDGAQGTITGIDDTMEYILKTTFDADNTASWTAVPSGETSVSVAPDIYYVRVKANNDNKKFVGEKATVTVPAYTATTYTIKGTVSAGVQSVTLDGNSDYTGTISGTDVTFENVLAGTYMVVVTAAEGYKNGMSSPESIEVNGDNNNAFSASATQLKTVNIATSTVPSGVGSVTLTPNSATAKENSTVSAQAAAVAGYETPVLEYSTDNGTTWQMLDGSLTVGTDDIAIRATYTPSTYTISKASITNGTITVDGGTESASFGSTVSFTVAANAGYTIGTVTYTDAAGEPQTIAENAGKYTFTMPAANTTLNATFTQKNHTVTDETASNANGSLKIDKTTNVHYGDSVKITIDPADDYELDTLTVDGQAVAAASIKNNEYTFTMPDKDVAVSATFKAVIPADPKTKLSYWEITDYTATGDYKQFYDDHFKGYNGYISNMTRADKVTNPLPKAYWTVLAGKDSADVLLRDAIGSADTGFMQVKHASNGTASGSVKYTNDIESDKYYYQYDLRIGKGEIEVKLDGITDNIIIAAADGDVAMATYTTVVDTEIGKVYTYKGDTLIKVNEIGTGEVTGIIFSHVTSGTASIANTGYADIDRFGHYYVEKAVDPTANPKVKITGYDNTQGTVTVTAGETTITSGNAEIAEATSVTVTIAAKEGYEIDTFTVGGVDKKSELSEGVCTFTMPETDVTIAVTFKATGGDDPTPPTDDPGDGDPKLSSWNLALAATDEDFDEGTSIDNLIAKDSSWSYTGDKGNNGVFLRDNTVIQITGGATITYSKSPRVNVFYYKYQLQVPRAKEISVVLAGDVADNVLVAPADTTSGYTWYTTVVDKENGKVYTYKGDAEDPITVNTIADGESISGITFKQEGSEGGYMQMDKFQYGILVGETDPDAPTPPPEPTEKPDPLVEQPDNSDLVTEIAEKTIENDDTTFTYSNSSKYPNVDSRRYIIAQGLDTSTPKTHILFDFTMNTLLKADSGENNGSSDGFVLRFTDGERVVGGELTPLAQVGDDKMTFKWRTGSMQWSMTSAQALEVGKTYTFDFVVNSKAQSTDQYTLDLTITDSEGNVVATGSKLPGRNAKEATMILMYAYPRENGQSDSVTIDNIRTYLSAPETAEVVSEDINNGEPLETDTTYNLEADKFMGSEWTFNPPVAMLDDNAEADYVETEIEFTLVNGDPLPEGLTWNGEKLVADSSLPAADYEVIATVTSTYNSAPVMREIYSFKISKEAATPQSVIDEYTPEVLYNGNVVKNGDEITSDLTVPESSSVVKLEWTSNNPSVVAADGTVNRPKPDTEVTLTAKVTSAADSSKTKNVTVTVKVLGVETMLNKALGEIVLVSDDDAEKIMTEALLKDLHEDVKLYTSFTDTSDPDYGKVTYSWKSDSGVLKIEGDVAKIYPTTTSEIPVTLTVTASALGTDITKDYSVTVHLTSSAEPKYAVRCDDLAEANFANVAQLVGTTVSSDINVPTTGIFGSTISWTPNVPMYMSNTGKYTAPSSNKNVTMTGIVSKGKVISDKKHAYSFTVKGKSNNQSGGGSGGGGGSSSGGRSSSYSLPMNTGTTTPTINNQPSNADNYNPNANTEPDGFTDLGNVAWAEEAINALADKGIISGRSEHIFDPDANITRAEFATIIVKAFGFEDEDAAVDEFADVNSDDWYYSFVAAAYNNGIISGYDNGSFGSYDNITRQDMAVIIYRAANAAGVELDEIKEGKTFEDEAEIAAYAADAVDALVKAGVINGMTDTEFAPTANATRAQAAKMTYELVK